METSGQPGQGLRARKKIEQRADLLRIASDLFRRRGYEETRVEDIAVHADVSTKTVYNYFSSKQAILAALLNEDRRNLAAVYEQVVENPPDDLAEALALLIRADIGDVRTNEDKKLWRDLLAAETRAHDQAEDEFESNRRIFTRYVERLLHHFRSRNKLSPVVSIPVVAEIVYAINAHNFRQFCASTKTPDQILKTARQQLRQLVAGWQIGAHAREIERSKRGLRRHAD